jgi:transposase
METSGSIFTPQEKAQIDVAGLQALIVREQEKIKFLDQENTWLREQLAELKRNRFGKKSERWESEEQLVLNEAEVESKKPEPAQKPDIEVEGHTKKRGHRKPLPDYMEREIVKIELPLAEQFAADGTPLKITGWEISEKLKYEPSKISVLQIHRAKYGVDSGDYETTAPQIAAIIPKGLATPELLAAIIVSKYSDGLPLYRLEDIFSRQGIELPRQTMARWVIQVAEACRPILNVLSDRLLGSFYVACDETKVQVLKENGRSAESKSWMWVRSTPFGMQRIVLFDYEVSRSQETAKNLFLDFKGFLQCDGLNAYDALESVDVIRVGCNMHARRRFEAAVVVGAKSGKSLGEEGLKFYQQIYDIEELLREQPPEERFVKRNELALPIWKKMKTWIEANKGKVPAKSKIGGAFSYFENEYKYLTAYLKDGRLELDNGFTERAIRKFAIGRNNWMFSDTEAGAAASALLYSLTVTAKVNGVNPYHALVKVFTELPLAKTIDDYERIAAHILAP